VGILRGGRLIRRLSGELIAELLQEPLGGRGFGETDDIESNQMAKHFHLLVEFPADRANEKMSQSPGMFANP